MNNSIAPFVKKLQDLQLNGKKKAPLIEEEVPEIVCKNCATTYRGNYCPNCGQKSTTGRLSIAHAFSNVLDILFNTEQGFLHTCGELLYRPGHMIRDYVHGHRVEYTRPIQLLFILTTIYVVLSYLLDHSITTLLDPKALLDEAIGESNTPHSASKKEMLLQLFREFFQNRAYVALFSSVLMVIPSWIVFRKVNESTPLSITEMFYILIFISSQQLLLSIIILPYDHFFGDGEASIGIMLPAGLQVWDFHQYFQITWRKTIRRYILSFIILFFLIIGVIVLAACGLILIDFDFKSFFEMMNVTVDIQK